MRKDRQNENPSVGNADISQYMTGAHVGSWIVLALALVVVACGAMWMVTGTLKVTTPVTGVNDGGKLIFYVSPEEAVRVGTASGKASGQVIELDGKEVGFVVGYDSAVTKDQIIAEYDNVYITQQLDLNEDNVVLYGELYPDTCADGVVTVDVVVAEMTPLTLLLG